MIGALLNNFDRSNAKYYEPYGKYYGGDGYQSQESDESSADFASANGNGRVSSNGHVDGAPADDTVTVPESAPAESVAASVPDVPAPPVDDAEAEKKRRFGRRSRSSADAAAIESAPLTDPSTPPLPDGPSKWD